MACEFKAEKLQFNVFILILARISDKSVILSPFTNGNILEILAKNGYLIRQYNF